MARRADPVAIRVRLDTAIMALEAALECCRPAKGRRAALEIDYPLMMALQMAERARRACNVDMPPLLKAAE